jgi:hypothetical protein
MNITTSLEAMTIGHVTGKACTGRGGFANPHLRADKSPIFYPDTETVK